MNTFMNQPHQHDPQLPHTHDEHMPPSQVIDATIDAASSITPAPKKNYYIDPDERIPSKFTGQTAEEIMEANNFLGDLT